ncbi:MAG: ABC transporter permease [Ferruginibacter sp.]
MIKNLLLIAIRNFRKDKWYSTLNVLGLTISITFSLFLIFYIADELSYDKFNKKAERIYRVNSYIHEKDKTTNWVITQFPLGPTVKKDFPEVEESARLISRERTLFKSGENNFYETKIYYADSTIFNVFTAKFLEGNPATALTEPFDIVITKSLAEKYFGKNTPAAGKTLKTVYDLYKVTGVIEDVPKNTHLRYDMLISMPTFLKGFRGQQDYWLNFNTFTYVLLKPGTSVKAINTKLDGLYKKLMEADFKKFNASMEYDVQKITDIHLQSKLAYEPEELGSMSYIWIFGSVAFFMLLIACINYMNLTTARSARRAKEIGIRKVTGSTKKQLVLQFLSESLFTSFTAVLLSVFLVFLLLPVFNNISGKSFTLQTILQPFNLLLLLGIILFTGLLGGSYPAFYLSSFKPVGILKGALSKASGNISLRRTLVVLQFSISMIMLISTWVVYTQLSFLRKKYLGFSKDQVMTVTVNTGEDERNKIFAMNNEFRSLPGVKDVGTAYGYPGIPNVPLNLFSVETKSGYVDKTVECYSVDDRYLPTLGIKIVKGRNFTGLPDTLRSVIVNESMVKQFGWGDDAVGKKVKYPGDTSSYYLEVVGVMKDFNQKSLYNPITPMLFYYSPNCNIIQLKTTAADLKATIAKVETAWKKYFPQLPFEYKFLDDDFNSQYTADQKRGEIFAAFSVLTIIITFLGLLGLTAFTTQQKQKEISIRRVLGASTPQVINLIAKNYLWLSLIAAAIAFPVAWYFMNKWLNIFPYNTGLSLLPFVISAFVIVVTAAATAGFHSAKAAWAKPAKVLKTE